VSGLCGSHSRLGSFKAILIAVSKGFLASIKEAFKILHFYNNNIIYFTISFLLGLSLQVSIERRRTNLAWHQNCRAQRKFHWPSGKSNTSERVMGSN